eukprot:8589379-Ditylum_brightwellii.AAC.1
MSVFSRRVDQNWRALGDLYPTKLFSAKLLGKKQYRCVSVSVWWAPMLTYRRRQEAGRGRT